MEWLLNLVAHWIWDLVSVWEEKLDRWKLSLGDFLIQTFCLRFREEVMDLDVCFCASQKRSLLQRGVYTRGVHTREVILKNKTRYLRLAVAFWIWDLVSVWEEKLDIWKLGLGDFLIQRFCLRFREEATDLDVCFRVARKRSLLQRGLYMYFEMIKRRVNWFAGALIFLDLVPVFSKKLRFICFLYDAVKYGLCFGCTCFETIRIVQTLFAVGFLIVRLGFLVWEMKLRFFVYFSVCKEIKLFFNYVSLITGYCWFYFLRLCLRDSEVIY